MKEAKTIVNEYNKIDFTTTKAALATVVQIKGSSYRREGARMLVLDNGCYFGGISGGCLEKDVLYKSHHAIIKKDPSLITYDTTDDDEYQIGVGLGCNGIIDVLITPLDHNNKQNAVCLLSKIIQTKELGILISIIGCDKNNKAFGKTFIYKNDDQFIQEFPVNSIVSFILRDIKDCLKVQKSHTFSYNYADDIFTVFIEIILPAPQLIIYGGNSDVLPLARIAKEMEWDITIVTNKYKVSAELFSAVTKIVDVNASASLKINNKTAVILMAHDYETDLKNFYTVLGTEAFYIGILGPKKRSQKMFESVIKMNKSLFEKDMNRIFAPAGLDIGANTPEEIALSILSEIKSCNNGRTGIPLRLRSNAIHTD